MLLQTLLKGTFSSLEEIKAKAGELFKPFQEWEELSPSLSLEAYDECTLLLARIDDKDFERLVGIFQDVQEAMGAFLSLALEYGWEEVPKSYCIYHAQEEGGKLIAGVKVGDQISFYEQRNLEDMVRLMAQMGRVVVYSSDLLTFIKDVYPEVDRKAFVIARQIAKGAGRAPSLEELAKIYGARVQTLEEKLRFIERLLENPVRLPYGEVNLPPFSFPVEGC